MNDFTGPVALEKLKKISAVIGDRPAAMCGNRDRSSDFRKLEQIIAILDDREY